MTDKYDGAILFGGVFPDEWWMRQLAGQVFAIVGRFTHPKSLAEAFLYTGDNWNFLLRAETSFSRREGSQEGTYVEQYRIPQAGTLYHAVSPEYFFMKWGPHGSDEKFNLLHPESCFYRSMDEYVVRSQGTRYWSIPWKAYFAISINRA